MHLNLLLSPFDLPKDRTQTKVSNFLLALFHVPYLDKNITVPKRNNAVPGQKWTVLKRNKDRTHTKMYRTGAKFLPHLHETERLNKSNSYQKILRIMKMYVSKYINFKYNYYEREAPYLSENLIFKKDLCKSS